LLFCVILLGCDSRSLFFYIRVSFISYLFIWVRGTLPRFRYNKLMYLAWRRFLPLSLNKILKNKNENWKIFVMSCTNMGTSCNSYLILNHRSSSTKVTVSSKLKHVNADVTLRLWRRNRVLWRSL
jgi:hypothetical protein